MGQAHERMGHFINWYNTQHRHSDIEYVTPPHHQAHSDPQS
ncbi:MAG: hypothetical protein ACOCVC_04085 [Spirochaeta sp.]